MTEEEAEGIVRSASNAESQIMAAIRAEVAAATAQIHDARAEELKAARQALTESRAVLRDVKDRVADHPWTGKRVFKLVPRGRTYDRLPPKRIDGIVETVRSTTAFPGNTAVYSRPSVGQPLVRLLTKDGTTGQRFDTMRGDYHGWKLAEDGE